MSLAQLQELPQGKLILLAGAPGAGKSTFCHQVVLSGVAANRPVILVTTERSPSDILSLLKEKGLGELPPGALSFVDAFATTVGLDAPPRSDTVSANCEDLNSVSVAITKLQQRTGRRGLLLAFDSLTSPYLFNKEEIFRFMRLCLVNFAAQGNSVLALFDEGCGKEEDLAALMSVAHGIVKMELENGARVLNVVKHPAMEPTRIPFMPFRQPSIPLKAMDSFVTRHYEAERSDFQTSFRSELGDFVNVFWGIFTLWGSILWDPQRFPTMLYDLTKDMVYQATTLFATKLPWYHRALLKIIPKNVSESPEYFEKRYFPIIAEPFQQAGAGRMEYVPQTSKPEEIRIRIHEGASSWGLENLGLLSCYAEAAYLAGFVRFFDREHRDWNAVETTCVTKGSPYCEFKLLPEGLEELEGYLTAVDSAQIETVMDRLVHNAVDFVVRGKPLGDRPTLGSGMHMDYLSGVLLALASQRYRMAIRMGGAMTGKKLAEHLLDEGLDQTDVLGRVVDLMEYCKVGKVAIDETVRIWENCESFGLDTGKPSCFFTTGFLNGLFLALQGQHLTESRCIAAGDPFCEWEIR